MLMEVRDLHAYYGMSHVLQGVSLEIEAGEVVAILGRNGMGKSTTLKTIMGLCRPSAGSIRFQNQDIAGQAPHRTARAGIGYVPEERRIFPNLSVLENLALGSQRSRPGPWTADRLLARFPALDERRESKGSHLSGGEQQMLSIGRALMGNPSLLLVDEPTEGLAPLMVRAVRDLLAEIHRAGVSILLVEHNLEVALSLAQRVYVMGKGRIGFSGGVAEFQAQPEVQERYLEV